MQAQLRVRLDLLVCTRSSTQAPIHRPHLSFPTLRW